MDLSGDIMFLLFAQGHLDSRHGRDIQNQILPRRDGSLADQKFVSWDRLRAIPLGIICWQGRCVLCFPGSVDLPGINLIF